MILHIILTILKIIGILLLVILGLLLFMVLAALFLPVEYRAKIKKNSEVLEGRADISWLIWLVWVRVVYQDGKAGFDIRILGIPVKYFKKAGTAAGKFIGGFISFFKRLIPRRKQYQASKSIERAERIGEGGQPKTVPKQSETVQKPLEKVKTETEKESLWTKFKKVIKKISGIPSAIGAFFKKIYLTIRKMCGRIKHWKKFLTNESFKEALRFVFQKSRSLIKYIRPRKVKGSLKFGFDDPALTGQALAGISLLYPVYKKDLSITPVFDDKVLELDIFLKGRFAGWFFMKLGWQIYRNKHIKTTIHDFKHKEA